MALDAKTLAQEMRSSVPGFTPSAEYIKYGLTYLLISNFGLFVCGSAQAGSSLEVRQAVDFLDSLLAREDPEAEKLVADCIEGLLECPEYEQLKPLFSQRLRKLSERHPNQAQGNNPSAP
jgi:hypothetical protein